MAQRGPMPPKGGDEAIQEIHDRVDVEAGVLHRRHAGRLQCRRGCIDCCVDDITVFEIEADHIRRHWSDLLEQGLPHPPGRCAFLDGDGACRIYAQRPYVCRTQGLPLRWLEERDGVTVELRDICHLNEAGDPIEELAAEECWTLGPTEGVLAQAQAAAQTGEAQTGGADGPLRRVPLRQLFARSCPAAGAEPG